MRQPNAYVANECTQRVGFVVAVFFFSLSKSPV